MNKEELIRIIMLRFFPSGDYTGRYRELKKILNEELLNLGVKRNGK